MGDEPGLTARIAERTSVRDGCYINDPRLFLVETKFRKC
jgi:hypothetical protein